MRKSFQLLAVCLLLQCLWIPATAAADTEQAKPYLVLVSLDGFRWDFPDRFTAPAMNALAARGIRADALLPVFPTLTFPNHYSIATGLYPKHHGIVSNKFPDPERDDWYVNKEREKAQDGSWYGGTPIWVSAAKTGMKTAAFFFVGTEAEIQGIRPDHWKAFDNSIAGDVRVAQVLEWLTEPEEQRPQLITLYFEDVDAATHRGGVGSTESIAAIARVDGYLQQLLNGINALDYGDQITVVLVSDHGQLNYRHSEPPFVLGDQFDLEGITPADSGSMLALHFDKPDPQRAAALQSAINKTWMHGTAYTREDAPASWMIGENPRFPDLILMAEPGFGVLSSKDKLSTIKVSSHGWAPETPEMHGIFIAAGPGIPKGKRIPAISVVDVYPLMLHQLGLPPNLAVDSDQQLWPGLLDYPPPASHE